MPQTPAPYPAADPFGLPGPAASPGSLLANFAALLADETRAVFCLSLLDGRAWTAGELAREAGVAASTASEHIGKLITAGLATEERQGRHRYVRLADASTAELVESLAAHVMPGRDSPHIVRASRATAAMARGRTCYDHLAGRLGVTLTEAMARRGLLLFDAGFALTEEGTEWFGELGIALENAGRRPVVSSCLDWTERRRHLAGVAGAGLCRLALESTWCARIGTERAVRVTPAGEHAFAELLGVEPAILR
ncbi:winged helix-turn-helix domain-containing protein [Streptomyces sp. NBC_01498]|uniref:ArsR/SmtB family transcription factor n=1 Tax=Streptomyces sp. NBC_01498 TaxID=2975870 RepID=UPI002E7ADCAC|nr:winged helix-turn-helix domain-containing protein [Streptomyces sp. NBC_01498]WTL27642.1 winged helix-turn-helix domain-containing protein [Streptomyces sp. NBC_01498]